MSLLIQTGDGPVDFVLHPTDLSEASLVAFHHALAIAVRRGGTVHAPACTGPAGHRQLERLPVRAGDPRRVA